MRSYIILTSYQHRSLDGGGGTRNLLGEIFNYRCFINSMLTTKE